MDQPALEYVRQLHAYDLEVSQIGTKLLIVRVKSDQRDRVDPEAARQVQEHLAEEECLRRALKINLHALEGSHTTQLDELRSMRERVNTAETELAENQAEILTCRSELASCQGDLNAMCSERGTLLEQNSALLVDARRHQDESDYEEVVSQLLGLR
jgi:septal ring factor EnvC (AmiA/AmiB activator)